MTTNVNTNNVNNSKACVGVENRWRQVLGFSVSAVAFVAFVVALVASALTSTWGLFALVAYVGFVACSLWVMGLGTTS